MMSYLFMLIFLIFLCFNKYMYWMVQMILLFFIFMFFTFISYYKFNYNISYFLSMDLVSMGLILLSIWISILMIMSSENLYKTNYYFQFFIFNVIFMLIMLFITFSSMNLFMFYLFFEGSLIPIIILILGWGYQSDRVQAMIYLLFYTLFVSLPLLLGIFFLYDKMSSLMIYMMKLYNFNFILLYISLIFAFLVKMPMYFVHLWLPKAHVEAPLSGSMILAGIMLKLGGYGLIRILILFQELSLNMSLFFIIWSLVGGLLISFICFCQVDMKSLVAYSSIVHMSMVVGGLFSMSYWGVFGAYLVMVGHGLCSSGLFYLININFERLNSRSLFINKGLINYMPNLTMWWFLLLSSNMAAPPSLNLMGELSLINSLMMWSYFLFILLMLISFFSAGYSLYLYSYSQHGVMYFGLNSFYLSNSREYLILLLHWFPLNYLILKLDLLLI